MYKDKIITHEVEPIDENIVAGKRSSGEYFIISQKPERYAPSKEDRKEMLEELSKEVSQTLGKKWQPKHMPLRYFNSLSRPTELETELPLGYHLGTTARNLPSKAIRAKLRWPLAK